MDFVTYALLKKYVDKTLTGAGALKGKDGKSAYEIAVLKGFSGSEEQWIQSLVGLPGETPYIGQNGNWFIGAVDTEVKATPSLNYNELENKPSINGTILEGELSGKDIKIQPIPIETINEILRKELE